MGSAAERFFHASGEPLCILEFEGCIQDANAAWRALLGYSLEELQSQPLLDLVHVEDRLRALAEEERAAAGHKVAFQCRVRAKDGSYKRLHLSGTPSKDEESIFLVARDLTREISPSELIAAISGTMAGAPGDDLLITLARQLASLLQVKSAFITECLNWPPTRVRTLAGWSGGQDQLSFEYDLAGTPCEQVFSDCTYRFYPEDAAKSFPDDAMLTEAGIEGYLAMPLIDSSGGILGHIFVLHDKPLEPDLEEQYLAVMGAFAKRIAPELERLRAEEAFRNVMQSTASLSGTAFFRELTAQIAQAFQVRYSFIADYPQLPAVRARVHAFWNGSALMDNFEYDLNGTPCKITSKGGVVFVPDRVQEEFPTDRDLIDLNAKSYLAIPMYGTAGYPIGHIAILDDKPMLPSRRREMLLKLFAVRATTELERMRAEQAARASEARFKLVVEHAADALLVYERNGLLVEVNPAACKSLGYSREELTGMHVSRLREGASEEWIGHEIDALRENVPVTVETVHRRKDGTTFAAEVRLVLFSSDAKDLVLAMARDVSGRRRG